jgi:hypothetical protein
MGKFVVTSKFQMGMTHLQYSRYFLKCRFFLLLPTLGLCFRHYDEAAKYNAAAKEMYVQYWEEQNSPGPEIQRIITSC